MALQFEFQKPLVIKSMAWQKLSAKNRPFMPMGYKVGVVVPVLPPDPGDVYLIQAFVASQAEFLVSGDRRDLLALGLPGIIGVAEFDRRLSALDFG